jgi:hypothetical protein
MGREYNVRPLGKAAKPITLMEAGLKLPLLWHRASLFRDQTLDRREARLHSYTECLSMAV